MEVGDTRMATSALLARSSLPCNVQTTTLQWYPSGSGSGDVGSGDIGSGDASGASGETANVESAQDNEVRKEIRAYNTSQ